MAQAAESEQLARVHLIPEASNRSFDLGLQSRAVGESEDGQAASYFRAQTRQGNDTRRVIVLHDPAGLEVLHGDKPPRKAILRAVLSNQVSIPRWWLNGLQPQSGFSTIEDSPRWLSDYKIIVMQNDEWRGVDDKGNGVVIADPIVQGFPERQPGIKRTVIKCAEGQGPVG